MALAASGATTGLIVCNDPRRILASIGVAGETEATLLSGLALADGPSTIPDLRDRHSPNVRFLSRAPVLIGGKPVGALAVAASKPLKPPAHLARLLADLAALAAVELGRDRALASADREREGLLAELDHRVKNVLAAVQSLASQSARRAVSLEGFLRAFSGRLKAMASSQELLTATRWRGADLHHLAAAELGGLSPGQTRWEGPELFLCPRAATALSLALHELAINAVKYGALSNDRGQVDVRWRPTPEGGFELDWTETGGPPVSAPTREGFGVLLIRGVTGRELNGSSELAFPPVGARAHIVAGPQALSDERPSRAGPEPLVQSLPSGASIGPAPEADGDVRGMRILIVEDAVLLAWELEVGLTGAGATVVGSAAEVGEAMSFIDQPMDAAVLDANLNGQSVRPVAEALAARGVPFLFATGYGENRGAPEGFDVPVIRKPYEITQIISALVEITRGRASP